MAAHAKNRHDRLKKSGFGRNGAIGIYDAIMLCLIIGLVPLIVYIREVVFTDPGNLYWDGKSTHYDIFSYYKMVFLLVFTAAGLIIRAAACASMREGNPQAFKPGIAQGGQDKSKAAYYVPMGIFALCVLLSAFASEYRQVAFFGFLERYEGAFVLLAYLAAMYLAMNPFSGENGAKSDAAWKEAKENGRKNIKNNSINNSINNGKKDGRQDAFDKNAGNNKANKLDKYGKDSRGIKYGKSGNYDKFEKQQYEKCEKYARMLFAGFFASAAAISVIGAFQYFKLDIYKSDFFLKLITPPYLLAKGGKLDSNFGEGTVFTTLYNPNYVGSYMAMAIPAALVFMFLVKKLRHKIALAALLILMSICLAGCESRAGIGGVSAAAVVLALLYRKKTARYKWVFLAAAVLAAAGFAAIDFASGGKAVDRLARVATLWGKDDGAGRSGTQEAIDKALDGVADIRMDGKKLSIITEKGAFQVAVSGDRMQISDENNAPIKSTLDGNNIIFTDDRFKNIKLATNPEKGLIEVHHNEYHLMDIVLTKDGLVSPTNRWLTFRGGREIRSFGFEGAEAFASNRGYIWSRTLPLLKETMLIGKGPDTFALYFPQYDFIGKLRFYQTAGIFVDKAHNMYLQTALNTGMPSLLAMLAIFVMYAISSLKTYWNEDSGGFLPAAGKACFTAFCGYAAAGLFNDSVVSVAPVFWTLLGLGIGINAALAREKKAAPAGHGRRGTGDRGGVAPDGPAA